MFKKKIFAFLGISSFLLPALIFLLVFITVLTTIGATLGANQSQTQNTGGTISDAVLAYQPQVDKYCGQYKIAEYSALVLAVMQQESGGAGNDPMQCSESPYNLKYPRQPGGIVDPDYSIMVGVQYLASCLKAAGCTSPEDIAKISLALQGYNFGGGYITWAQAKGGYTATNAAEFSEMKAQQMGWTGYGDTEYVAHVLRYYSIMGMADDSYFNYPLAVGTYTISSGFGYRWGKLHKGVDFAAAEGTKIYAAAAGTVVFSGFGMPGSGFGGYGNVILIKHDNTYSTLYAHCIQLLVPAGTKVQKGSVIALVGSTGDSTGNHCHFEIRVNGEAHDPMPFLTRRKMVK